MAPSINPLLTGQLSYTVNDSARFLVAFTLDTNITDEREITIVPAGPPGFTAVLRHVNTGTDVALHGLVGIDVSVPGREIEKTADDPPKYRIRNIDGNNGVNEPWQLRVTATDPQNWTFSVDGTNQFDVTRLLCDPNAAFATPPPATVLENTPVNMLAADATVGTVVGAPVPDVVYRWEHTGTGAGSIVISDLPSCGPSQSKSIAKTPGVYAEVPLQIVLTAGFDTDCAGLSTAFLSRSATAPMAIQPRPQQIALLLDRSGSMSAENRWTNAEIAARMLTNLFHAIRGGAHPDDRIGIVVFEDTTCAWHGPPAALPADATVLPMAKLGDAQAAICALPMGAPGACTPIGDGLIAAIDMLATGGPAPGEPDPNAKFTLVLLSDGFENAGSVQVSTATPPQPGVTPFATARAATPQRVGVNNALDIYTVGLGSTVDTTVLNSLAAKAKFLAITDPTQLADAFGQMLSVSQEVAHRISALAPPSGNPDPSPPPPDPAMPPDAQPNAVYFVTSTGAEKLAVGVLAASGTIELGRRTGTGAFISEGVITPCNGHIIGAVGNVPAISTGTIEWRVVHTVAGAPQHLPAAKVLAYEDLHVKADFQLDRNIYGTGDKMRLTVRIRHDEKPILDARVKAILDAPEVGLGEALSELGPDFTARDRNGDAPVGRGLLIEELLERKGWKHWPHGYHPPGLFTDGTDELHDPDRDGNYTNTFASTFEDGTYTWEILVEGTDTLGNLFTQRLLLSTQVVVKVDPRATRVDLTRIPNHPSGMRAVRVVIVPQDARGKRLGPGFDDVVIWSLDDGTFEHAFNQEPAPVFTDGTYRRVILYREHQRPRLAVSANTVVLPRITITAHGSGPDEEDSAPPAGADDTSAA